MVGVRNLKETSKDKFNKYLDEIGYNTESFGYIYIMQKYIQMADCKDLLELGVRGGLSTIGLLYACEENNSHLYSVEIINEKNSDEESIKLITQTRKNVKYLGLEKYWTFKQCNDLDYECDREYDFIFIDTSHEFKQTLLELEKFSGFIKIGKTIFLHDTLHKSHCRDVMGAIGQFMTADFDRSKRKVRGRWIYRESGTQHGLGMLERIA